MRLSTLITILAPAVATVQARCYSYSERNGVVERWDDSIEMAAYYADQACNSGLSGYFTQEQTKYRCYQLRDRLKVEFWVEWDGRGVGMLNNEECKRNLRNEIGYCTYGGESYVEEWGFRSDPNEGWC